MTTHVPAIDLKAAYLAQKAEIDAAVQRVLASGWYILGQEVEAFEQEFAEFIGTDHCVSCASGTDALELALRACDLPPGTGVVTVSHTAVATVAAIERAGLTPLLVDIAPATYTMDPAHVAALLDSAPGKTGRAIIPVHLYGQPADLPAILDLARQYDLRVIEDCAQAHGARLNGRTCGTWGDIAAFSFYPTKNLGASGDGGAVVTRDEALAERAAQIRQYGWRTRYVSDTLGINSRLDEMQAAILRVRLTHLAEGNEARQRIAQAYTSGLQHTGLTLPDDADGAEHVYHLYVIQSDKRDELQAALKKRGIGTGIHYPAAVHQQPAYKDRTALAPGGLPHTEAVCSRILSLPMYPEMTEEQVQAVIASLLDCCKEMGL